MFRPEGSNRAEMLGPPGSGKSWLWTALGERLVGRILTPAVAADAPIPGRLEALRDDPRTVAFLAEGRLMLDRGDADQLIRRRRKQWLSRELTTVLTAEAAGRPVLCDEGLVQCGISVAVSYGNGGAIAERYFHMTMPPRAVIVVEAPRSLIEARITAREPQEARHLLDFDGTATHVRTAVRILRERGSVVIAADGARLAAGDAAELARVAEALRATMAGTA